MSPDQKEEFLGDLVVDLAGKGIEDVLIGHRNIPKYFKNNYPSGGVTYLGPGKGYRGLKKHTTAKQKFNAFVKWAHPGKGGQLRKSVRTRPKRQANFVAIAISWGPVYSTRSGNEYLQYLIGGISKKGRGGTNINWYTDLRSGRVSPFGAARIKILQIMKQTGRKFGLPANAYSITFGGYS